MDALLAETFPENPPPFYRVPFGLSDVERLRQLAQSTGFTRLRIDVVPHDAPVASWAGFADGLIVGNPVADQLRRRGGSLDDLVAETASRLEAVYGAAPVTIPVQTIFFRAYTD
ncbi:hypothetical protein [Leifsonia xyli]|uniref:hypothetical protein n=1 Tax=Leifsonia xyli TaxID=1575 RepID=UPI003D6695DC